MARARVFQTQLPGQILGFLSQGAFDLEVVGPAVLILPPIPGALWVGTRVRRKVDMETYRGMPRAALRVISNAILVDALRRMFMA